MRYDVDSNPILVYGLRMLSRLVMLLLYIMAQCGKKCVVYFWDSPYLFTVTDTIDRTSLELSRHDILSRPSRVVAVSGIEILDRILQMIDSVLYIVPMYIFKQHEARGGAVGTGVSVFGRPSDTIVDIMATASYILRLLSQRWPCEYTLIGNTMLHMYKQAMSISADEYVYRDVLLFIITFERSVGHMMRMLSDEECIVDEEMFVDMGPGPSTTWTTECIDIITTLDRMVRDVRTINQIMSNTAKQVTLDSSMICLIAESIPCISDRCQRLLMVNDRIVTGSTIRRTLSQQSRISRLEIIQQLLDRCTDLTTRLTPDHDQFYNEGGDIVKYLTDITYDTLPVFIRLRDMSAQRLLQHPLLLFADTMDDNGTTFNKMCSAYKTHNNTTIINDIVRSPLLVEWCTDHTIHGHIVKSSQMMLYLCTLNQPSMFVT